MSVVCWTTRCLFDEPSVGSFEGLLDHDAVFRDLVGPRELDDSGDDG